MGATTLHHETEVAERHPVHSLEYASAAARTATDKSFTSIDIGRVARQTDDGSFWLLKAISGSPPLVAPTWASADGGAVDLPEGLDLGPANIDAGTTVTISESEYATYLSGAATKTVTLSAPSEGAGSVRFIQNTGAGAAVSASSNVKPLGGGSAGTEILPAIDGAWVILHYEDPHWNIIAEGKNNAIQQGTHTLVVAAGGLKGGTTDGATESTFTVGEVTHDTLVFLTSTTNAAYFSYPAPKSWNPASTVSMRVWFGYTHTADEGTGLGVSWSFGCHATSSGESLNPTFSSTSNDVASFTPAAGRNKALRSALLGPISPSGSPAVGDLLQFKVFRNTLSVYDTLERDVHLIHVEVYLNINAPTDD